MRKGQWLLVFTLVGCASTESPERRGVLTVATVGEYVLVGFSKSLGTAGSFTVQSVHGGSFSCDGTFRYPRPPDGTARFHCSDGRSGSIRIKADGVLSGGGEGKSSMGPIHVVYGYSIEETNRRIDFPVGKVLVRDERGVGLVDVVEE